MQKILIIKLGALGDFILATGLFKAIRQAYPQAQITLLTGSAYLDLAKKSGFFDAFEIDNRTHRLSDWMRVCKKVLAEGNWDLIFDLQRSSRTTKKYYSLARLVTKNAIHWALYAGDGFRIKSSPAKRRLTWGKTSFSTIKLPSIPPSLAFCYNTYSALQTLPKHYVLMIPGCSAANAYKRWPAEFYGMVAKALADKGIHSIVIGTNAEKDEIETVCRATPFALNFCNKNKLLDIPDLAHHAMAVIGNDTGPMHMAELTDTPCLSLFCDRTNRSALERANVTNLIGQNIEDISPKTVIDKLLAMLQ